jgi:suppressor of G2 allele of SKP1
MGYSKCDLWVRKCQAEIRKESSDRPVVVTQGKAPVKAAEAEVAAAMDTTEEKNVRTNNKKKAEAEVVVEKPPETLATKVKPNWTQNAGALQITLFAKNLTTDKVLVTLKDGELRAALSMPDGSTFDKTWHLYAPVQEDKLRVKVNAFKVEIAVDKTSHGDWRGLEADAKPEGITVRQNQLASGRVPPPYSSNKDWNEVEQTVKQEEQAEKPEGNEALQKLFQQIYADGDPEVRRAMMKSYQTSGGTVLSTNWGDVAKKDYEKEGIIAPKGQEVRKWNE